MASAGAGGQLPRRGARGACVPRRERTFGAQREFFVTRRKIFGARESIGSVGRKLCYAPAQTRQRSFGSTRKARDSPRLCGGYTSHKGADQRCPGRETTETT